MQDIDFEKEILALENRINKLFIDGPWMDTNQEEINRKWYTLIRKIEQDMDLYKGVRLERSMVNSKGSENTE